MNTNKSRITHTFAALAGVALSVHALLAADLNPIARWSFEDADNLGKDSVGSADMTCMSAGAGYSQEDGYHGKSIGLRKGSGTVVADAFWTDKGKMPVGTSPFTVMAWLRPASNSPKNAYLLVSRPVSGGKPADYTGASWEGWVLRFMDSGSNLALDFQSGWRSPANDSQCLYVKAPQDISQDGKWHHFAISRDANMTAKIYVDGCLMGAKTLTTNQNIPNTIRFAIGGQDSGNSFSGDYDEVCVFDRALTEAEIVGEYFRGNDKGIVVDELGRIVLNAPVGTVVTNEVSYDGGSHIAKTGEGSVLLYHSSTRYMGSVGVTNGLLRTGETSTLTRARAFAVEEGATLEFGRSSDYAASISGAGEVKFSGSGVFNLTGNVAAFCGAWSTYLATVNFGTAAAPILPEATTSLKVGNGGFVNFYGDVTVSALSGKGLPGGVALPDGKTLTVAGDGDTAFAGCLAGRGSLVKSGAGELALSGASEFTNVTVSAGTLALDRADDAANARSHWKFEDAEDLSLDSGSAGIPLKVIKVSHDEQQVDGVCGKAIRIGVPSDGTGCILATDENVKLPRGTAPYTFSAWLRPTASTSTGAYLVRFMALQGTPGNWTWTGWGSGWYLCYHTSGTKLAVSYYEGWSDVAGTADCKAEGSLPAGAYNDGQWHHVVITLDEAHALRLYWDGALIGENLSPVRCSVQTSARLQLGSYEFKKNHNFDGDIDEVQYVDGAWSAERVAEEYAARRPLAKTEPLPTPLAKWTFDEFETDEHGKFFRDTGTAGWNFYVFEPDASHKVECIDGTHDHGKGANGGAAYVSVPSIGAFLRVGDYVSPTNTLPDQNPDLTISIRFRNTLNNAYTRNVFFALGSVQTRERCFRLTYESEIKNLSSYQWWPKSYRIIPGSVNNGDGWELEDTYATCGATSPWVTLTFVNESITRTVTVYRDGAKIGTYPTNYTLELDRILLFAGYYNGNTPATYGGYAVDDLRLYHGLLTPAQVQKLAYEQAGLTPAPLAQAKVSLAGETTLRAKGGDHVAAAVSGSGNVQIDAAATFGARDWSGFTGTVAGEGALALYAKLPSGMTVQSALMVAGAETDLAGTGLPVADAADKTVRIASSGVVRVTDAAKASDLAGKVFVLARAASFDAPVGFAGWTIEPSDPEQYPYVFAVRNGEFSVKVKGGGLAVILR